MTASRDPDRLIRAFLHEGEDQLTDQVYDAVRAAIDTKRQRAVIGPWRTPVMNRIVTIGLGAAAVVLAIFLGTQVLGSPSDNIGGPDDASSSQQATTTPEPTPTATPWSGLSSGPFQIAGADGIDNGGSVKISVDIASPGWTSEPSVDFMYKNDDGLDAPDSVGGALIGWTWPAGTGYLVYGDPCRWTTTTPESPATTAADIAAAFLAQAQTAATQPVDVTVGGYAGKALTLTVPMSYEVPGATREQKFGNCDEAAFAFYGVTGERAGVARDAQGAGQIDELWILDVEGSIVILDATYSPATPAELVQELRALAESATFEVP